MARYRHIDTSPRFLAVDLQRQLLPCMHRDRCLLMPQKINARN